MHAPVGYSVWWFGIDADGVLNRWVDYAPGVRFTEWEVYAVCAELSKTGGPITARSADGNTVHAVFCNGNRVWHALESTMS